MTCSEEKTHHTIHILPLLTEIVIVCVNSKQPRYSVMLKYLMLHLNYLGVSAPLCYAHVSWNEQKPVRLIANCDTFRVRKRIDISDFFLTYIVLLFHRLEIRWNGWTACIFKNYFVVLPVDSSWNKRCTVICAIKNSPLPVNSLNVQIRKYNRARKRYI